MKITKYLIAICLLSLSITVQADPSTPAQKVGLQFLSATVKDVSVFLRAQPNCCGDVGPEQYIEATNQNIRSFNKKTGKPDGILDIDTATFLGTATGDVMLTYDRWGERWIVSGDFVDQTNPTYLTTSISIAWSDGPVITKKTKWTLYQFSTYDLFGPTGGITDSPKLSSDKNAVYLHIGDAYADPSFDYLGVYGVVIPQSSFKEGNQFNFTVFPGLFNPAEFPAVGGLFFAPSPDNYDADANFGYIVVSPALGAPAGLTYTNYYMLRILNPGTSQPTLYPSPANPISLAAPVFSDSGFLPHLGNLYGTNGYLQNTAGATLDHMPHVRNKQLYIVNVGLVDSTGTGTASGDRSAILWYQYDLTGDPTGRGRGVETQSTVPVLIQSGVIYDPTITETPINYFNPALMSDKDNNLALIGNSTGANNYIQAFYTGRKANDTLGTLRPLTLLTNNNASYNFGTLIPTDGNGERWGDYCSLKPDPCNDRDIWATSQVVDSQDNWGILTTQLIPAKSKKHRGLSSESNPRVTTFPPFAEQVFELVK